MQALRGAMRAMPAARAPDFLRAKIEAMATPAPPLVAPARARIAGWGSLAATIAALGVGLAIGWTTTPRGPDIDREILDGHLRGMISMHAVDVASSDQHTVKPWFAGKLAVAPVVPDLAAAGFPLVGGRIDVVAGEPAPTLVYRAGGHVVSVVRLPIGVSNRFVASSTREIGGHTLVSWSDDGTAMSQLRTRRRRKSARSSPPSARKAPRRARATCNPMESGSRAPAICFNA